MPNSITDTEQPKEIWSETENFREEAEFKLDMHYQHILCFLGGEGAAEGCCLSGFSKGIEDSNITINQLCLLGHVSGCGIPGLWAFF